MHWMLCMYNVKISTCTQVMKVASLRKRAATAVGGLRSFSSSGPSLGAKWLVRAGVSQREGRTVNFCLLVLSMGSQIALWRCADSSGDLRQTGFDCRSAQQPRLDCAAATWTRTPRTSWCVWGSRWRKTPSKPNFEWRRKTSEVTVLGKCASRRSCGADEERRVFLLGGWGGD